MGSVTLFLYQKLVGLVGSFLFSVSRFLLPLFSFISSSLFRWHKNDNFVRKNFHHSKVVSEQINQKDSKSVEPELETESDDIGFKEAEPEIELKQEPEANTDEIGFTESEDDREGKKVEFSFTFRFPTFEEFSSKSMKQDSQLFNPDSVSSCTSSSKYDFMSSKSYCGFVENPVPDVLNFNVQQVGPLNKNLEQVTPEAPEIYNEQTIGIIHDEVETEKNEATTLIQEAGEHNSLSHHEFCGEVQYNSEKDSVIVSDNEAETINSRHVISVASRSIESTSDGFLSDGDFGGEFDVDHDASTDDIEMSDWMKDGESDDLDEEEESDILNEFSNLEAELLDKDRKLHCLDATTSQFLSQEDFRENSNEAVNGEFDEKDDQPMNGSYDSEKLTSKDTHDFDDSNKLETLWEHQELIEQLKMELRKVRATGLPTILEESESPKIIEDLKPWKIDEKFQHEDCMDELHKFYKSYSERMRKFDIFNYQKMYAIGFLQLKDPLQPISSPKTSGPKLKSLLSQNFWQLKHKSSDNEPMIEFMKELQCDLEVVYVGQMCLSWEFLHWQYGKALDLWDSDPRGIHRYNEVAGEFQQFQVLMQRFTEDEYFQGPRVQYYIKRRCILRNLLQVPVIREDNLRDKRKGRRGEKAEYVITSDMLVEIIEESIRIFWRFVRADKDCSSSIAKGHKGILPQLQKPGDLELLMEVKSNLRKKERKLKDLVRSENCILRRFRKCREDDSDHVLYFFSQLDMKLVSRVLNMTRITTDQLVWCHSKLSRISFEDRKIQVEPSFLLFPC